MASPPATPTPSRARTNLRALAAQALSSYGLLVLLLVLVVAFSLARPDTFPTAFNARSIISDKSIVVMLALAETVVIAAGHFDLSVGYGIGLAHILSIYLQVRIGLPWPLACLTVVLLMGVVGLINGLLVTRARIDSFIATLGIGTFLWGISSWCTNGEQIIGNLPHGFREIAAAPAGFPLPAVYVLAISLLLWVMFDYLPVGRYLYVLGDNPKAAELTGISSRRYTTAAFVASGLLTGIAGVVLGARLGVGQSSVGAEYLLPAFVGALLGATAVRPGRVNVWGTVTAVLVLGVAVAGLQQLGAQFYVEPLFNGAMLVTAVGLAGYAARRRIHQAAARHLGPTGTEDAPPKDTDEAATLTAQREGGR